MAMAGQSILHKIRLCLKYPESSSLAAVLASLRCSEPIDVKDHVTNIAHRTARSLTMYAGLISLHWVSGPDVHYFTKDLIPEEA